MEEIKVLILGTDINSYYMARCYHELTGKKADVIGKREIPYTNITNPIVVDNFNDEDIFIESLMEYGKENKSIQKILLIATSDLYVKLVSKNRDVLDKYYIFNYPDIQIVNNLLIKEKFYTLYKDMGLEMPKTFIYDCALGNQDDLLKEYFDEYPIIIKPSDGVEYHKLDSYGLAKVYKAHSTDELDRILDKIKGAGYNGKLIIQEFIPGDDSCLFDSIFYVNKDGKAMFATFAQIGLQEHTPTGIGNCTVLVNGFNEHGYDDEFIYGLKDFIEKIGYTGFAEFDIKYDYRDKKYKVLEINPRQSRSGYYVCACGYNLVKVLIDDLFYNKDESFKIIKEKRILSFVPYGVIKKYVKNSKLLDEIKSIKRKEKIVNPLRYRKDKGLRRKLYLFLRDLNYYRKYKNNKF